MRQKPRPDPHIMATKLKQINISYNPVEDRLLLRISSESEGALTEYRLWLTRRFAQGFWNVCERIVEDDTRRVEGVPSDHREALKEFQQEAALSTTDFKTPYAAPTAETPLGPAPLLISKLQAHRGPGPHHTMSFVTAEGKSINLAMTLPLIHSIRKLIADAVEKTGWNLPLTVSLQKTPAAAMEKPRRIN